MSNPNSKVKEKNLGKTKTKKAVAPQIVEREYGRYLIKAGLLQNTVVARAFPKPPSKFRHLVAEETGENVEDAVARLIAKLEALRSERRSLRRTDPAIASGVPTTEEYADALRSLSPGPKVLGVLHDHALARRLGMQLAELVKSAEFTSEKDLLSAYEKLGAEIARVIEPDENLDNCLPIILAMADDKGQIPEGAVSLQPELQDALLRLLGAERRSG